MLHNYGIDCDQEGIVVQLFKSAAILPAAPSSVRQLEMRNTETGQSLYFALTLLRQLATGEPAALHVTIPGIERPGQCFFVGDWLNTFVDLGETTTFFVEHDVDIAPLVHGVSRYVQGECSESVVPELNPAHHAIWVHREDGDALADTVVFTRREACN